MKKSILILTMIFLALNIIAQKDTAIVKVKVLNEFNKPIVGEQIIFDSKDGTFYTKNITDNDGVFKTHLLGGKTYDIKVKTIGEAKEYNTFEIPALQKGTRYSESILTITIYESKSFTLDNVYFDSGKSLLKEQSFKELNELFEYLTLKPNVNIEISGHTDNVGNDESNMLLSNKRTIAVKEFLIEKGISENRLQTKAYGETKPIASNETSNGRSLNRRIEVLIIN